MYVNTKKELFLGTHKFDALGLTKTELLNRMTVCLTEDIDLDDLSGGEYDASDLLTAKTEQDRAKAIVLALKYLMENRDEISCEVSTILDTDLHVDGSELLSFAEEDDWCEVVEMTNGMSYIKVLGNTENCDLTMTYVVLYIGADNKIHGYVPTYGNLVFAGTNCQLCASEGNDSDEWDALMDEFDCDVDPDDYDEYNEAAWDAYNKKFRTEPSPADDKVDDGEVFEACLELNEDYIQEDICSNAVVVQA